MSEVNEPTKSNWDWSKGILSDKSAKTFQSNRYIMDENKDLKTTMLNLYDELKNDYKEHADSCEEFDKFLKEVTENVMILNSLILGKEY